MPRCPPPGAPRPRTGSPARSRRAATSSSRRRGKRSARAFRPTVAPIPRTAADVRGAHPGAPRPALRRAAPRPAGRAARLAVRRAATRRCVPAAASRSRTSSPRSAATTASCGTRWSTPRATRVRRPTTRSRSRARCCATSTWPTTEASGAFLEAQQLLLADGDRVRRDLLEDLLAGRDPETAAGLAAARDAGLDATRVVRGRRRAPARRRPTTTARSVARRTRSRRRLRDGRTSPLAVTRHGEIVLVRAIRDGERPALAAPLERACAGAAARASRSPSA